MGLCAGEVGSGWGFVQAALCVGSKHVLDEGGDVFHVCVAGLQLDV